eukprot:CAMPEP_0172644748 /NCGR_PEP_ID=MMETSP1068-20121228/239373_1 /TAXON_ID=35684 /ORGANISM="Pseudopedinella elastica, Strain CCMP716" /LENGTH=1322 /DNA_ID=CAMNT_0013458959 /DNA_START=70 /DNA_END=4040 /DNA_ORIENTATION=-
MPDRLQRQSHDVAHYSKTGTMKPPFGRSSVLDSHRTAVSFKRANYDVMDNKRAAALIVERSRSNGKLVVRYSTEDEDALDGENYAGTKSGTCVFRHGEKVASINVELKDTDYEEGETVKTFRVRLTEAPVLRGSVARVYDLKHPSVANVRIWDNGEPIFDEVDIPAQFADIAKYANEAKGSEQSAGENMRKDMTCRSRLVLCMAFGETPVSNQSEFMTVYDLTGLLMILYTATVTPFQMAFIEDKGPASDLFWIDRFIDLFFFGDIILNFFRPVHDFQRGVDIIHLSDIRSRYLKGWFATDIITTVPFDVISLYFDDIPGNLKVIRLFKLLRLMKVARMLRAARTLQQWQNNLNISNTKVELMKIFVVVCFASHWMACIWGMIATSDMPGYTDETQTWFYLLTLDGQDSGMLESASGQYIAAAYFAVMTLTTVGYGDIHPITELEHYVCILFMLLGGVTWAYLIGVLTSIVTNLDRHGTYFKQVMDELNYMIEDQSIPEELATKIRSYWRAVQHLKRLQAYEALKGHLSDQLQGELAYYTGSDRYSSVYYLSALGEDVLLMLANLCSRDKTLYAPGEKIYERCTLCIIINSGQVGVQGKVLSLNDAWGTDFILENPLLRRDVMALCLTYSEVEKVTIDKLQEVLAVHTSEARLVGRARARLALIRGLPRLVKIIKTVEDPRAPLELRKEGLRLVDLFCGQDYQREEQVLARAKEFRRLFFSGVGNPYRHLKVNKGGGEPKADILGLATAADLDEVDDEEEAEMSGALGSFGGASSAPGSQPASPSPFPGGGGGPQGGVRLRGAAGALFRELDTNGDGVLSLGEIRAGARKLNLTEEEAVRLFMRLDADGNGVLDDSEFGRGIEDKEIFLKSRRRLSSIAQEVLEEEKKTRQAYGAAPEHLDPAGASGSFDAGGRRASLSTSRGGSAPRGARRGSAPPLSSAPASSSAASAQALTAHALAATKAAEEARAEASDTSAASAQALTAHALAATKAAEEARAEAKRQQDDLSLMRAELLTQRDDMRETSHKVGTQADHLESIVKSLADLRQGTAMVLSAQVKILDALGHSAGSAAALEPLLEPAASARDALAAPPICRTAPPQTSSTGKIGAVKPTGVSSFGGDLLQAIDLQALDLQTAESPSPRAPASRLSSPIWEARAHPEAAAGAEARHSEVGARPEAKAEESKTAAAHAGNKGKLPSTPTSRPSGILLGGRLRGMLPGARGTTRRVRRGPSGDCLRRTSTTPPPPTHPPPHRRESRAGATEAGMAACTAAGQEMGTGAGRRARPSQRTGAGRRLSAPPGLEVCSANNSGNGWTDRSEGSPPD